MSEIKVSSKVRPSHLDRRVAKAPTDNGEQCHYLDYKMITIGFGLTEKDAEQDCLDPKTYIQEELNPHVYSTHVEKQFFKDTYWFQKEIALTHEQITNPFADQVYVQLTEYLEHLKDHHKVDIKGCLIQKDRQEKLETTLTETGLKPIELMVTLEKYPLCNACDHEYGAEYPIQCDYKDWVRFGDSDDDLRAVCRRYEYYQGNDKPVDTHQRVFTIGESGRPQWVDKGVFTEEYNPFKDLDEEGEE